MTTERQLPEATRTPAIKKSLLIGVAVLCVLVTLLWFFGERLLPPEPTHKGKPVREWVELAVKPNAYEYDQTIREIGGPAVPLLIRKLRTYETPLWRFWSRVRALMPEYIQRRTPKPEKYPAIVRSRAAELLGVLANYAQLAVSELVRALSDENQMVRSRATVALGEIGPTARAAVPKLLSGIQTNPPFYRIEAAWALLKIDGQTNFVVKTALETIEQSQDEGAAMNAILLLGEIPDAGRQAVPLLNSVLADGNRSAGTRGNAANALGNLGIASHNVVSNLEVALKDSESTVRFNAARSLWLVDKRFAATAISVASEELGSSRMAAAAASLLGEIGPSASNALPRLIWALDHVPSHAKGAVSNAIDAIQQGGKAPKTQL